MIAALLVGFIARIFGKKLKFLEPVLFPCPRGLRKKKKNVFFTLPFGRFCVYCKELTFNTHRGEWLWIIMRSQKRGSVRNS